MAGIFANIDSDIQKLQKLKQEIENVKKSLKSINVKVDIDIAQGLEAQLKSLTTQYNVLAAKVGETEAKITASANKIIDASNKIIQAQEKITQANKGANVPSPGTSASTSTNTTETASIQAQVKAYEELKTGIDDILGTRGQNIKRLIEEQNAIRLLNAEIKKITKSQGESSNLSSAQQRRLEQLNNSLLTHKTALAEVKQSLSANAKLDNAAATSMDALSQSLGRMRAAYRAMTDEEKASSFGKELLISIQQADSKIKELDATIGNHQRNVGNYASGWNGLSMSIQQIGRELPSLAVGWSTFFLAISNNLPILADEIKRARIQFEALKKSGQTATPVWKQVVSSIVSWQTALTVGITLLTLYGDKLVKWISGLGKAEEAIKNLYTAQRDLYNVTSTGIEQSSKEITKLNSLYKIATDVTKSTKERNNAVKELKKSYPEHLKNLSNESIKNGEVSKAIKEQTNQIIANAKATAAADQIARNWYKSFQAGVSKNIAYITKQRLEQELVAKEATVQQLSQMRARPESYAGLAKEIEGIKDRIKETDREIAKQENLQDSYQKSSKALEKLVTVAGLGGKYGDPDKNYNSILDQQKKIANLLDKQALERRRKEEDLENQVVQSRIDAMADGEAKIRAQRELDNKKEIQDLKRQREDYIRTEIEYQKKLFDAQEDLNAKKSKDYKKKTFDPSSVKVDTSNWDSIIENREKKQIKDLYTAEANAMRKYLKEYGTFQQQKLAIAEEYAEKIKKASTEGEKLSLGRERDSAIQQVDINALNQKIDWQSVFGNFSGILGSQLKETLDGLKEYVNTDKFKNSSEADKKIIYEAIDRLREVTPGGEGTLNFNKIQQQMDGLGAAINRLQTATLNQDIAFQNLKKAENDYANALKTGDKGAIDSARQALDLAKLGANAANDAYKSAEVEVQNFGNNLRDVGADTVDGLNSVASGLQSFADSTLPGIFRGLQNTLTGLSKLNIGGAVGDAIGKLSQTLSSAGVIGQIISAVLSILDILKDGIGPLISSIIDTVLNAVNGILDNILSGDMFVQIFSSIKDGIGNILNTISFGGFNSLMDKISGSNAKEVQEAIDRLTDRNETLEKSIDRLTDVMEKSAGVKSISAYEQAYKYQQEQIANTLKIAQEQARYSNSHHSWKYYMEWTDEQLRWARKNVDNNFSGTESLWGLSPEQMKLLLSNADIYEQIKSAGKGGYGGRVMEKLEAYADQAGKLEELTEKINESIMQISFDGLRDNFLESLMDMDKDAKSFSEDFSEYMQRALLNFSMGDLFDDELKAWYNSIADLMKEQSGKLTKKQIEDARKDYDLMVQKAMNERDKLAEITGYTGGSSSSSQESTKKGFAAASQDSIEELNGRFTALQIAGEEIKNQNQLQTMSILELRKDMLPIVANTTGIKDIASETRDLLRLSYEAIMDIRDNTNVIVKPIQQMASDIAEVKRNTNGLTRK